MQGKLAADWASTPELKALLGVKSNAAPEEDLSKVAGTYSGLMTFIA